MNSSSRQDGFWVIVELVPGSHKSDFGAIPRYIQVCQDQVSGPSGQSSRSSRVKFPVCLGRVLGLSEESSGLLRGK